MSDKDTCGHPTADGSPCQHPATEGDSCWIPSHGGSADDHGRDPKLTKERQEAIASAIEQGASITEAARKNGIHRETFGNWMKKGQEQGEGIYADFFDRLTRARGQGEASYRSALMQIAIESDDTATLMAMLKQRYPESWGDVDRGEQQGGVVVNVGDPDEYEIDPDTLEVQE
jgi:transposase-like protein